jgi:DNA-binding transcriptional regulator YiaG
MPPAAWARIFGITSVYGCKRYGLMKMPVLLQCTHSKAKKQVIVDSGVMSNFISSELLKRMKIGKRNLPKPRTIWLMHGTRNEERHITHYVDLLVGCGDKSKELRFLVTDLGEEEIILGYPWLKVFQPKINWKSATLDEEMHPLVISTTGWKIDAEVEGIQEAWTRRARTMATSSKAIHVTRSEERRLRRTSASTQVAVKMLPKEEKTRDKEVPPQRNGGKKVSLKDEKVEEIPRRQPRDTTRKTSASTQVAVKMLPKKEKNRDKEVPPQRNCGKKVSLKNKVDEIPWKQPWDTTQKILASTPGAVKMSPKEEGTRDKVVPPRRHRGKKVLASQGKAEEIPRTQPWDTAEDTLASTPVAVKMSPKEEGARDKVVPPRRDSGKKVLASQGTAEEIPRMQPRDTAQKTSASTQEGVKMLPKEKGARNKVVSPQLQWKKALSQEEEATKVPWSQPEDIATDLATEHSPRMDKEKLNVCTMPEEEVSDRKPRVVLPPRGFKRTEAQIAGHEDAHPTDGKEERQYLAEVDPENHQPSTELAVSDQQEDDRMDQIVVAGDNNLKGGVIPHHDTPKQENPGISNQQDAKQFMKGSAAEERPLKPAKIPIIREQIPITMEQLFRFLTAAMDLLIQWLTVGRDTPGQETTNPQMRYKFPSFGPPKKVITARRTRFTFQQTRERWQATKILACNLWPSARTKRPCEEVTRGSLPQTEWKTKTSPVPKETARLADLEEIRRDTLC